MKRWLGFFAGWTLITTALAGDWPHWRGPDNNGISPETIQLQWPESGPKALWAASVGTGMSSISVSQGRAYTMGNTNGEDTVWCLDAKTGKEVWKHSYSARLDPQYYDGGPGSTPTVFEGHVFTISKWGDVFCFDAAKGSVVWAEKLWSYGIRSNRWGFAGSPVIYGDLVILNAGTSGVALERATGRMAWFNGTNVAGYATPEFFDGPSKQVLIFGAKNLYAVDPMTGKESWRFPFETGYDVNNTDPIIQGNRILLSSYNRGCALVEVVRSRWWFMRIRTHFEATFLPESSWEIICIRFMARQRPPQISAACVFSTGEVKWSVKDPRNGSLISASGKLLILSDKGELIAADPSPDSFKPFARAQVIDGLCWTPPSLANGCLYVRNSKGKVVCLEMSSKL
jgi:outer membrane protein assembly factor BamB